MYEYDLSVCKGDGSAIEKHLEGTTEVTTSFCVCQRKGKPGDGFDFFFDVVFRPGENGEKPCIEIEHDKGVDVSIMET